MGKHHSESNKSKRDPTETYKKKVRKITAWYNHLIKEREKKVINPNTQKEPKRKPLKDLDYYISQLKKVSE